MACQAKVAGFGFPLWTAAASAIIPLSATHSPFVHLGTGNLSPQSLFKAQSKTAGWDSVEVGSYASMSVDLKKMAGEAALAYVESGMRLGLGTGSTAEAFVKALGVRVAEGLQVVGVPTSERTAALAQSLNIPLTTLEEVEELNVTVDGADEIGPDLVLVKGGGGALLREKIVAAASRKMIVIADGSKVVDCVGAFPLPIEVVPFGLGSTTRKIVEVSAALDLTGPVKLRSTADGAPFVTDGGHFILDASFRRIPDPEALAKALAGIPGVVDHGLFIGLASLAIVARETGVEILNR